MKFWKQAFALLLTLAMVFSLTACGSKQKKAYEEAMELYEDGEYDDAREMFEELDDYEDSADMAELCEIKDDPVKAVYEYVKEHGTKTDTGRYLLEMDTDSEYLTVKFSADEDSLTCTATSSQKIGTVLSERTTMLDVVGGDPGGALIQSNTLGTGSNKITTIGTGNVNIEKLKSDTRPSFDKVYSALDNVSVTDEFVDTAVDGINCIMEELTNLLKTIRPELTLKDLGVNAFELDTARESAYREGI